MKDLLIAREETGFSDNDYNYEYDEFLAIIESDHYYNKALSELLNLTSLNELEIADTKLKPILKRQIYIGIIGVMETFLCDAFINLTFNDEVYFKNFIETHPEFKKQKFELRDIFSANASLNDIAKKVMLDTIYHNLPMVSCMYKDTFKIDFPNIDNICKFVLKRHDFVHRNGKSKDGELLEISDLTIKNLIEAMTEFIKAIAQKLELSVFA